ncbi:MAG: hypothetical protein ACRD9Q_09950 [Nitrososphaeraceae archaeon]
MGFGPVSFATGQSIDEVAPGAPVFVSVTQIGNVSWDCVVRLPETDSDGSPLTGLIKLAVATAPRIDDTNPFEGQSMDTILATPNVPSDIVDLDAESHVPGSEVDVTLPVTKLGDAQQFAASCSD